jgi:Transcriptional regulator, AbiEi antitoxin
MGDQSRKTDRVIGMLASGAHGVVTRQQLLRAGVTRKEIDRRLENGRLFPQHRGVYRVGHRAPSIEATYLAAAKAGGEGALVSGQAAAHLLYLIKGRPPRPELTTPTERRVRGVITRRSRSICAADAALWRGVPVTTVQRTLVDLAAVLAPAALARACHEAGVVHKTTPAQVREVLQRQPNAPGAANLLKVIHGDVHVTLSKLERGFLKLLGRAGLPLPETNRRAGGRRVDCRWPEFRLTVELDSYRYHNSRHAWEQDRRREREARARGDEFRRYTYADVFEVPQQMLAELQVLLLGRS